MLVLQILYFSLGILITGLIFLLLLPVIWKRAVRITTRRIETANPMTLSEIRAEKDLLRAEYAVQTRKLEMIVDDLQDKSAQQRIDLDRQRQLVDGLQAERDEMADAVQVMENRERALNDKLLEREERLAESAASLRQAKRDLQDRHERMLELDSRLTNLTAPLDGIDFSEESETDDPNISALRLELKRIRGERSAQSVRLAMTDAKLEDAEEKAVRERDRRMEMEETIVRLRADLATKSELVDRRDREITRLKSDGNTNAAPDLSAELQEKLDHAKAEKNAADAEIARLKIKIETLASEKPALQTVELSRLREQTAQFTARISELEKENKALVQQSREREIARTEKENGVSTANVDAPDALSDQQDALEHERRENAHLSQRVHEVTAQIALLNKEMAQLEKSTQKETIAENPKEGRGAKKSHPVDGNSGNSGNKRRPPTPKTKGPKDQADGVQNGSNHEEHTVFPRMAAEDISIEDAAAEVVTLADRIKALQKSAG